MIQPLGDRILVEPQEEADVVNGIIIPDTVKTIDIQVGTVLALGTGIMTDTGKPHEFKVKVGDKIGMKRFTPDEVKEDGVKYLIVKESDVLGIIKCK
jgi:chaperonin GroES